MSRRPGWRTIQCMSADTDSFQIWSLQMCDFAGILPTEFVWMKWFGHVCLPKFVCHFLCGRILKMVRVRDTWLCRFRISKYEILPMRWCLRLCICALLFSIGHTSHSPSQSSIILSFHHVIILPACHYLDNVSANICVSSNSANWHFSTTLCRNCSNGCHSFPKIFLRRIKKIQLFAIK